MENKMKNKNKNYNKNKNKKQNKIKNKKKNTTTRTNLRTKPQHQQQEVLNFRSSLMLRCKILPLIFEQLWCYAVRSQPDLAIIWDATV